MSLSLPAAGAPLPTVSIAFGANAAEPGTHGRVVVLVNFPAGATPPASLEVFYEVDTINSTATGGSDYEPFSGSVVLTPDMGWGLSFDVAPIDDGIPEGDEQIVVRLKEDPHYAIHIWWPSCTVILADDEQPPPPSSSWIVATTGSDQSPNDGSLTAPFATLWKALTVAHYGDTIYLRSGTYREAVTATPSGWGVENLSGLETSVGSWNRMLTIRNYQDEEVFIKGSDVVVGWQETSSPDPQMRRWQVPWSTRSQQVFVDGQLLGHIGWNVPLNVYPWGDPIASEVELSALTNAAGISVLQQTTAHMTNWSFFHDVNANLLYIALPLGVDPNTKLVEASTKIPFIVSYDYVHVKGLKFRHSNTLPVTGGWPGVALRSYSVFEECDIQWCDCTGVSIRDQSRIINCLVANNGLSGAGVVGTNVLVSGSRFLANHYLPFDFRGEAAGAKIIGLPSYLDSGIFEDNEFGDNNGRGLWFDTMTVRDTNQSVVIRNNWIHHNASTGLRFEVMNGARAHNNLIVGNSSAAVLFCSSSYCWVHNNTLVSPTNSYATIWFDGGYGGALNTPPHHCWITNNIMYSDERNPGPNDPQVLGILVLGECTGARELHLDYNCYVLRGNRPLSDYFVIHSLDVINEYTGPECTVFVSPCRTNWAGWQAFGFESHGFYLSDSSTIARLFVDEAQGDYRITSESPAARAGLNLSDFLNDDFAHRPRPTTGNFSLGAFEFIDTLSIVATDAAAAEAGPDPGLFTITRESVDLNQPLTVTYLVSGSATSGADYAALPETLIIPAGTAAATLQVTPVDDALGEGNETITLTLNQSSVSAVSTSQASATVTIAEEVVTIIATDAITAEPGDDAGTFTVSRQGSSAAALTVYYTVTGTATAGSDYVALSGSVVIPAGQAGGIITVTPLSDTITEVVETVVVILATNSAYVVGLLPSATVSILNAPTVGVTAGANAAEPSTNGFFTISRTLATATPLAVVYAMSGSATPGNDYAALSGSATIPANSNSVRVTIAPINDSLYEGTETVTLTIQNNSAYNVSARTAAINLMDNDPPLAPTGLSATPGNGKKQVSLAWNPSPSATTYKVKRSKSSNGPFSVIATVATTNYLNTGLPINATYYYKVSAVNGFGQGADSGVVSITLVR